MRVQQRARATQRGRGHRRGGRIRLRVVLQGAGAIESVVGLRVGADIMERIVIVSVDGIFVGSEISWFARTMVVGIHF